MGYKCAPQIMGLTRNEPKPNARHRANGKSMLQELGNERYSRSDTLDRTRSHLNEYEGFKSGKKCWESMCNIADSYRIEGTTKNGVVFSKALRKDAVIGYALIINPPAEMTVGWSTDDYAKFYADSFEVLTQIEPRIFNYNNNQMYSIHRDEGLPNDDGTYTEHCHFVGLAQDEDGRFCGNLIDAKLCSEINKQFPALMRAKGWELDDLDVTDWNRAKKDKAYRNERNAKRRTKGKNVNKYIADKAKRAGEAYAEARQLAGELKAEKEQIDEYEDEIVTNANRRASEIKDEALDIRRRAKTEAKQIVAEAREQAKSEAYSDLDALMQQLRILIDEEEDAENTGDGLDESSFHLAEEKKIQGRDGRSMYDHIEERRQKALSARADMRNRAAALLEQGEQLQQQYRNEKQHDKQYT